MEIVILTVQDFVESKMYQEWNTNFSEINPIIFLNSYSTFLTNSNVAREISLDTGYLKKKLKQLNLKNLRIEI